VGADAQGVDEAAAAARAVHGRLLEAAERQRFVHHVADLDSGATATTELDRPVTPLSRLDRLSQLGHRFLGPIFGAPEYRLTPKAPYQATPEGWVEVSRPTYYAPAGSILWWEPPRDFDVRTVFLGLHFTFTSVPAGRRSVVSMTMAGSSFAGATGHLLLQAQLVPNTVTIPITGSFGTHTVDFTFVTPQSSLTVVVALVAGIEQLTFSGASFGAAPPVLEPAVFA
jgi:hypothetical protein